MFIHISELVSKAIESLTAISGLIPACSLTSSESALRERLLQNSGKQGDSWKKELTEAD